MFYFLIIAQLFCNKNSIQLKTFYLWLNFFNKVVIFYEKL